MDDARAASSPGAYKIGNVRLNVPWRTLYTGIAGRR